MYEERRFPIFSFISTVLFILLGGWVAVHPGWGGVGAILIGVALLILLGQLLVAVLREYRDVLKERAYLRDSDTAFYKEVRSLSDEDKAILGLARMPKQTHVIVEERSDRSSMTSEVVLSVNPVKIKALCQALAQGTSFTIRSIAGSDKLLSDGEFRTLSKELVEAKFLVYNNATNPEQGYSWTPAGQQWIEDQIGL
jgi:hypothetical protein